MAPRRGASPGFSWGDNSWRVPEPYHSSFLLIDLRLFCGEVNRKIAECFTFSYPVVVSWDGMGSRCGMKNKFCGFFSIAPLKGDHRLSSCTSKSRSPSEVRSLFPWSIKGVFTTESQKIRDSWCRSGAIGENVARNFYPLACRERSVSALFRFWNLPCGGHRLPPGNAGLRTSFSSRPVLGDLLSWPPGETGLKTQIQTSFLSGEGLKLDQGFSPIPDISRVPEIFQESRGRL